MNFNWTDLTYNSNACCIAIVAVALTAIYCYLNNRGAPPGPVGLPYFGYWPFLKVNTCHLQLFNLKKKYGDVYSFTATGQLYVILASLKANREAFVQKSECFNERIKKYTMPNRLFRGSVITLDGEKWKTNRKFFSQQFRERGLTSIKGEMCGPIYDAIIETVAEMKQRNGEPVDIVEMLTDKCTRILFKTCFGESGVSEKEINELIKNFSVIVENISGTSMFPCGAFAKYFIFPFMPSFRRIIKHSSIMENMLYKIIVRHRETYDENNIRNLIDAYHKEKLERFTRKDTSAHYFTDFILAGSLIQFVGDGVLAVASFIGAYLYSLIEHPEEQEKIYNELMEVIGSGRDPTMDDKNKLPYTNAFISEILRTSMAFPFFPKMQCTKDVTICGQMVPKGAAILVDNFSAHLDPEVYEYPEKFDPSRFLQTEGKKKTDQPMLFGMGKHSCLGEGFTMLQVFLFMTTILKHFRLAAPRDKTNNDFLFFHGKMIVCAHARKE